jgi:hypothetical protein
MSKSEIKNRKKENNNKTSYYVDKQRLNREILEYHQRLIQNPDEKIPEYVGEAIINICRGVVKSSQFNSTINLQYRDEMIGEAVITCVKAIKKIDPSLGLSSFSYLTTTAQRSCLYTISKEKDFAYTKFNSLVNYYDQNGADEPLDEFLIVSDHSSEVDQEIEKSQYLQNLRQQIANYENGLKKKAEKIKKKQNGLDSLFEDAN